MLVDSTRFSYTGSAVGCDKERAVLSCWLKLTECDSVSYVLMCICCDMMVINSVCTTGSHITRENVLNWRCVVRAV